jgi:hypothetical protein
LQDQQRGWSSGMQVRGEQTRSSVAVHSIRLLDQQAPLFRIKGLKLAMLVRFLANVLTSNLGPIRITPVPRGLLEFMYLKYKYGDT